MLEQASSVEEREQLATDLDIAVGRPEERGDRAVIGRLIRRLRISDSPQHFQTVATTVLRTSLEMAAVAWVPKDPHESAVISGSVSGLNPASYRGFPSPAGRESTLVYSFDGNGSQQSPSADRTALRIGGRRLASAGSWQSTRSTTVRSLRPISSDCSTSRR